MTDNSSPSAAQIAGTPDHLSDTEHVQSCPRIPCPAKSARSSLSRPVELRRASSNHGLSSRDHLTNPQRDSRHPQPLDGVAGGESLSVEAASDPSRDTRVETEILRSPCDDTTSVYSRQSAFAESAVLTFLQDEILTDNERGKVSQTDSSSGRTITGIPEEVSCPPSGTNRGRESQLSGGSTIHGGYDGMRPLSVASLSTALQTTEVPAADENTLSSTAPPSSFMQAYNLSLERSSSRQSIRRVLSPFGSRQPSLRRAASPDPET
ncbi:hypothetical protein BCV70DRAFT_200781 [Testicularia cyperi]|uniref:Uncharacterized protein n=1 Tax=Testicularia cyperi TaxID=1882483 RepID=A0A317XR93_9BASI|nr:hypothetical protein BCV70DRAFT_200781 [Testicularia cyperi]